MIHIRQDTLSAEDSLFDTSEEGLPHRCVEVVYMTTLLRDGYGFPENSRNVTFALEADGMEVGAHVLHSLHYFVWFFLGTLLALLLQRMWMQKTHAIIVHYVLLAAAIWVYLGIFLAFPYSSSLTPKKNTNFFVKVRIIVY